MSFSLEVQETEKLKDFSVSIPARRDPTLPPESEPKEENGKEPEEEDDHIFKTYLKQINHIFNLHQQTLDASTSPYHFNYHNNKLYILWYNIKEVLTFSQKSFFTSDSDQSTRCILS